MASLSVLVGNGLSIAFNPALGLGNITQELVTRMGAETDGDAVSEAMRRIADTYSPTGQADYNDFENFVGAFGGHSSMLEQLVPMAALVEPGNEDLKEAIETVADFARKVRDRGISHVLQVILEESKAHPSLMNDFYALTTAIVGTFRGRVTFGNLNYDTLLLAALLWTCQEDLCDLGNPMARRKITTNRDSVEHRVPTLRQSLNFPAGRRVRLIHLHGSLTYWITPKGHAVKLDVSFLERYSPFDTVRTGGTSLRPAVVLANQKDKSGIVSQYPFSLAYEGFSSSLEDADHWLVIGYSFRDLVVNGKLRTELESREEPPKVLVVTMGTSPTRREVETAVGWDRARGDSKSWLTFDRSGASGMQKRRPWKRFAVQPSA